jgi:ribosomal-protein-alanine N-acetyltransferase
MKPEDIPAAVEIEQGCFSRPWSAQSFTDSLSREDTLFLVCVEEETGKVAGYMGMYLSFDEADITNVAVSKSARRKGCGTLLVETAKIKARERQAAYMLLEVRVSNEAAIALYKKMGFEEIGIRKNFYDFPTEDAKLMNCNLL